MSEHHESGPTTQEELDGHAADGAAQDPAQAGDVEGTATADAGDEATEVYEAVPEAPEAAAEEAAQAPPAEPEEPEELTWQDRVARLVASSTVKEGAAAVAELVKAMQLVDLKDPGDFLLAEIWGDALQRVPEQAGALWEALSRRISTATELWEQVSIAHQVAHGALDGDTAAAVGEVWGWVQVLRSGESDAGVERLKVYAEASPKGFTAQMLEAIEVAASGNWRKVETTIGEQLSSLSEPAREVEVAHRMADIGVGQGGHDRAVEVLRRAHRSTKSDASLGARLATLYRDTAKWNAYVDLLKAAVDEARDVEDKVDLYQEMVRVYGEEMNLDAMVVKSYEGLLEADPGNVAATQALASAYENSRRWPDLVSLLQKQVDAAKGRKRKVELSLRIAHVYLDNLSRQVDAITWFEKVLEQQPTHAGALTQLKDLYERRREWEKLIDVHKAEISALTEPVEKVSRLKEVADIATKKLRKPAVATEVWQAVLEVAPGDTEALDALEFLHEREKEWPQLAGIIEKKAELASALDEQLKLWQKLGSLFSDRIGESGGAIRAWRQVLALDPEHLKAVDSLRKLLIETKAWDDLEAFYGERDAWQDLVRMLETLANTSKDAADTVELLFRAARVWETALQTPERAQRALEKVLETEPSSARAAELLQPYYAAAGDHAQTARMLQVRVQGEAEVERRTVLALELASELAGPLDNPTEAFDWLTLAIEERPGFATAYGLFEAVGRRLERASEVVASYGAAEGKVETADERQELMFRRGAIMAEDLGQVDAALAIFEEILDREPDNLRALGALERILEQTGRFDELIAVNERRLGLATRPEEEAEILLSGARIHEAQRGDKARAIQAYERVRELTPTDTRPLLELHRLYREAGDHEALANVLRALLALLVPTAAADGSLDAGSAAPDAATVIPLYLELGTVAQRELREPEEAVECYAHVVALDPEHEEAREALEGLLEEGVERGRVAVVLEPVYAYHGDFAALVSVLRVQFESTSEAARQTQLLVRIGTIYRDEIGDHEEAFSALSQALRRSPADDAIVALLQSEAALLEAWDRLASEYEGTFAGLGDDGLKTVYDLRLAELFERRLEKPERALEYGRRALARSGSDEDVLEVLEALYLRTEAWADLFAVIERQAALLAGDAEASRALKMKMAGIKDELLDQKDDAIGILLEVLNEEPSHEQALTALDRLYGELERWEDAAANLGRRLELQETDEARDVVRCELAAVLEKHLGEPERAIEIYQDVLGRDASNPTALSALEGMLEQGDPLVAEPVVEILLPLYDAAANWRKRAWADEMMLKVVDDTERRQQLLFEIARLHEEQGQEYEVAFVAYARALAEDPSNEETVAQLYRYADALGAWDRLVEEMRKASEQIDDGKLAKQTLVRAATIYQERLQDIEGATATYERASELDPEDGAILDALEGIYREQAAWEPLTAVLAKKAALADSGDAKKELLFQAALICEEMLDEPERAATMFQEVLALDPLDGTAIDSLERLYLAMEKWDDLMSIYSVKVDRATSEQEQKELHYVVGALQEKELQDRFGAVETYRKVLDLDPDDAHALEALDGLYSQVEDWPNLLEILEREEEAASDPEVKLAFRYRRGEVWHRRLDEPMRAIDEYRHVLEVDAGHEQTLEALEDIIEAVEHAVSAAEVLEPVYRSLGDWDRLVAVHEVQLAHADSADRRIELLSTVGMIREDLQADGVSAFEVWLRAVKEDPTREASWEVLERIAGSTGRWDALVERGAAMLDGLDDTLAAIAAASRLARAYEEQIGSATEAIAMWRRVLEYEPTELTAIRALDGLFERQARWPELTEVLRRQIELAGEEDEILTLRYRLGTIYENFLDDVPEAISNYNEMLLLKPGNAEAIEALERMFGAGMGQVAIGAILEPYYRDTEQWESQVEMGLALLEHFETSSERYQKLLDLAEVFIGPLGNAGNALFVYGRALVERPGDELAMTRLLELAEITQSWEEAVDFMRAALDATDEATVQRELLWKMAQAYDEQLGNHEQAEGAYLRVLELEPDMLAALQALDRIYTAQARLDDLVGVMRREIQYAPDDFERIGLYLRLGSVLDEMLADSEGAIEAYREVLAIDPAHGEALGSLERIHYQRQEWDRLYEVYSQQSTVAESGEERAEKWARMAHLAAEVLERRQEAVELWYQVLDVRPEDVSAMGSLERLFELNGRWADMADILERQVPLVPTGDARLETFRKLGRLWSGPLENDERALEQWRKALEVHPEDLETLRAIKRIDEVFGDYEDLVDIIRRIVALGQLGPEEQLAHYVQLGEILGQVLVRAEEAIETWIQVLQLEPFHLQALNALEQLYVDGGRWEEAVDVLDRKAEVVAEPSEALAIRMQIAEIWETQVGNVELAAAAYDAVLDLDPANDEAFHRLEGLHTQHENWQQLLGLYVARAEVTDDAHSKLDILRRGAAIAEERLGQPEMAFVVLQGALLANWRNQSIAAELERLAELTHNWRELVGIYENIIEDVRDPKEALELHNNVARWYFHKLNDNERSWHHFQTVLGYDPNNLNALAALAEIYRRLGSWEELVSIQVRRSDLSREVEDKVELLTNVATVWEKNLSNDERAVASYRQVLELDEGNLNALRQLERIFQASQRWRELVEVLEQQCRIIFEPDEVVRIRFRIGELWETCIEQDKQAIEAYRQVLAVEETHREALEALERLFTRLQRWQDLIGVYEMQLTAASNPEQQIALYTKMATVYEEEFQDANNAISCMQHITMVDPTQLMAIQTLERLYRENLRWPDLVDALTTHISVVSQAREQVELYRQLGEVFRDQLQDYYRAIESFRNLLELEPNNAYGLEALANLYYQSADWAACIETLDRLVHVVRNPAESVGVQHRVGQIFEHHLAEYDRAEDRYQIALDIDPAYMPAIDALQQLYERREDYTGVIRILKQKVEYTLDLGERADLLCLIGQIYDQRMGDPINAIDYYEQTLALSPSNVWAARPLAEKYVRELRWARAETLLEMLVQKLGFSRELEDHYLLHYWLGLCAQELGQGEKALKHFRESYELNQSHLPTLLGMGRQLYRAEDYDRAYKMFQTVLVQYQNELNGEQLVQVYYDSAQIKTATGDPVQAQHLLERVLEIEPTHQEAITALIELNEEQENWEVVVQYKRHRIDVGVEDDVKFSELTEIAEIYRHALSNSDMAVACYKEALTIEPDSKLVLLKLLDVHTQSRQWSEALANLEHLVRLETADDRLAKFHYTMAVINRDEIGDDLAAVACFNLTLDSNVNELRAFEAIDRILTAMKDWRELERNYRKMIKRVYDCDEGQFEDTKFLLWYGLAEIYRTRLTEWESAISAFQQAAQLRPNDPKMHRILADLFVRVGNQDDNAIKEYQTLINMAPDPTDPYAHSSNKHERNAEYYHALFKLYLKTKRYDQAWCVTNVMSYLRLATDEEKQFNERYLGPSLVQAQGRLTPETWKMVYHPTENLRIGNVLNVIQAYCRDLFAYDLKKTWSLKKKDELDQNADFLFCKMYRYLAQVIGVVPAPKLYLKRDQALGMLNGNLDPPGFIVGADMMQGRGQRELAFIIARQLALALPIHYMGGLRLPTENLKFLMLGAIQSMSRTQKTMDPNMEAVVKAIHKMPPPVKIDLGKILKPILDGKVEVNMSAWLKAIDHTANHVGLLLCGDVEIAMSAIKNDPAPISKLTVPEKEAELLVYAISDEFFDVRSRLGLAIT